MMKVTEIMTTNVECVTPETTISELAEKMKSLDVGFLAVCDADRIAGIVTDRDIVVRGIAGGRDLKSIKTRDIMSKEVHWCFEDEDVKNVAKKMSDKEVRRMLLLDRNKRLVGIVSIGDIAKVEEEESGRALRDISKAA
jgi:CBS domain-containing protein